MKVILIIFVLTGVGGTYKTAEYPMPSWEICQQAVKEAQVEIPTGGDAEALVVVVCGHKS